ncbi:MAG: inverse autotransporter beta domain-containing protein [Ignavibacteriales bacterium]|nr:inverse autotransporter beta domain-containing protein [Ignavibacteriales bacterium]
MTGETIGSSLNGFYAVAGYDVLPMILPGTTHYLAPFIQYEQLNTQASVASGYTANKATDRSTLTFGLSYKPHPNVAFKFDYRDNKNEAGTGLNQWNVAVNYLF